jgi:hypothetical protein
MKYIYIYLLLYYPFMNHVIQFIFSKEWSLKWYSIMKFKYVFFKSIYLFIYLSKKVCIIERITKL